MIEAPTLTIESVTQQLRSLGVKTGGVLIVHCAFSKVRPVENGPLGLIEALQNALGPEGTLVMPAMTDDEEVPFDVHATPCRGMGITADTFWRLPGVLRCDSPHSFSAHGPQAAEITRPQPVDIPHGIDSPVGRVYEMDGQVLLLGVGHTENTTIHLGEFLAGARYRRPKSVVILRDGEPLRVFYGETDHCCDNFSLVDGWLDAKNQQSRGRVGHAEARLMRSRDVVEVVTEHLRQNETAFLHPFGVDDQCDEARMSIGERPD
ncbi:MAG: AAC(3) family N-acetyltransferase [Anaerolineaceae bacterium]|nr:AAC(3) family N-acetyltransferase [Anaerolineaceae bacterium]